jgi:hypothetical protein
LPRIVAGYLVHEDRSIKAVSAEIIGSFSVLSQAIVPLSEGGVVEHLGEMLHDTNMNCKTTAAKALLLMSDGVLFFFF